MSNAADVTIKDAVEILARGFRVDARGRRSTYVRTSDRDRCYAELPRREIYSYGRHFPLCRFVPRALNGGPRDVFVINGDVWRGSRTSGTADHQRTVRAAIEGSGVASVIIPFSALDGAGIEIDSIRPIHTRPDVNTKETRTARDLAQVPRHLQTVTYDVPRTAETFDAVPERYRETYRIMTDAELGEWSADHDGRAFPNNYPAPRPLLPDADGLYRWNETRKKPRERDADGLYRWTVSIHRLGDAVFSATRAETFTRPAAPFESERATRRETVSLFARTERGRGNYCDGSGAAVHESGPSGACVHCGAPLVADVMVRRRARYLSSFDTNELPPLYFLAALPRRGAGCETVEIALDSLAPRAVHAARARGRRVERQGDVFFIETDLTDADLLPRTVSRARLTQWTRDARARKGETGYRPKLTAAERRRMDAYARREFRRRFQLELSAAYGNADVNAERRARSVDAWTKLRARHAAERAAVDAAGIDSTAVESSTCGQCGAAIGAACVDGNAARAYPHFGRDSMATRQRSEIGALQRRAAVNAFRAPVGPETPRRGRRRYRKLALEHFARVDARRAELRAAILGADKTRGGPRADRYSAASHYDWQPAAIVRERHAIAARVTAARRELDAELARGPFETRQQFRDAYRARFGTNAVALLRGARIAAREKYDSAYIETGAAWTDRREKVRRALTVYGTAHSATEVIRARGGSVYVRGTVIHRPDLVNETRDADHRPLVLESGRWYLAVRNAVPRQSRRRARVTA